MLIGVAIGWVIRSSTDSAFVAGASWLLGSVLLTVGALFPRTPHAPFALALLPIYALTLFVAQPSMRADGNTEAAVIATAICLVPAAVGGVALPRIKRWIAAAGCWFLLLGLSAAAAGTVSHRTSAIGLFGVIWD
jgi:hypothetical protein